MAIYVTGDTHGEQLRFTEENMPGEYSWTEEDILIVCGDFGYLLNNDGLENVFLNKLEQKPYAICFVDGNHENFPAIYSYPVESWNGGMVHRIRKNIYHLMRGEVFNLQGKSFLAMGGAYSVDRYYRRFGFSWWEEEMPTEAEYDNATANIKRYNGKIDYVLTHTAPESIIRRMGLVPSEKERMLGGFLEWIRETVDFKRWFFGHWHLDKEINEKFYALFFNVVKL